MLTDDPTKEGTASIQLKIVGILPDCDSDFEEILQSRETFDGLLKVRR